MIDTGAAGVAPETGICPGCRAIWTWQETQQGIAPLSHNIPPDFASELSRLMDKHGVDRRTARAALQGRRGRSKSLHDVAAAIEIAIKAEGLRDPLQDFINGTLFD